MNEQELRAIVRAAVARHLQADVPCAQRAAARQAPAASAASHALYTGLINVTEACVIEPAVLCDHCWYCKSQGY